MNNYEMYHSGIKGMKWGIRRYQNKDGTLTEEGKKRYGRLGSDKNNLRWVDKTAMRRSSFQTVYSGRKQPGPNQQKVLDKYKKEANNSKYEKELQRLDKIDKKWRKEYLDAKSKNDEKRIVELEKKGRKLREEYMYNVRKNSEESMAISKKYVPMMNEALVKDLDFQYTELGANYLTNNGLGWDKDYLYNRAWFGSR